MVSVRVVDGVRAGTRARIMVKFRVVVGASSKG